jgi:hypothetical protein
MVKLGNMVKNDLLFELDLMVKLGLIVKLGERAGSRSSPALFCEDSRAWLLNSQDWLIV